MNGLSALCRSIVLMCVCVLQVSAWGGYVFIINLIPLHVFVLLLMQRYSRRLYIGESALHECTCVCLSFEIHYHLHTPHTNMEYFQSSFAVVKMVVLFSFSPIFLFHTHM